MSVDSFAPNLRGVTMQAALCTQPSIRHGQALPSALDTRRTIRRVGIGQLRILDPEHRAPNAMNHAACYVLRIDYFLGFDRFDRRLNISILSATRSRSSRTSSSRETVASAPGAPG